MEVEIADIIHHLHFPQRNGICQVENGNQDILLVVILVANKDLHSSL